MKIYSLMGEYYYEGMYLIGVFSSMVLAVQYAGKINNYHHLHIIESELNNSADNGTSTQVR